MIYSMTGFARSDAQGEWGELHWELRSVNHRYLDISLRVPEDFRDLEPKLRDLISQRANRGKIECTLRFTPADSKLPFEVDEQQLRKLAQASDQAAAILGPTAAFTSLEALQWPGVLNTPKADLDAPRQAAIQALTTAASQLETMRAEEGGRLAAIIQDRLKRLNELVTEVEAKLPDLESKLRAKLNKRLAEIDINADAGRLEQELAYQLQRMDVDEELDRLRSHITAVNDTLGKDEAVGRKLDFLIQECNREANTLASKSQAAATSEAAVEMKVVIEQMREQVQNIE